ITPSKDGLFFPQLATRKSQLSLLGRKPNGEMGRTTARTAIGREEGKHGAYYDAKIGRFLQSDSMAFPNQIQGMNRMMYVEGNPVGFRDESGNKISTPLAWGIIGYIGAAQAGKDPLSGFIFGYTFGKNTKKHEQSKLDKNFGLNRAWDSIIGVNGLFRWIKNTTYPTLLVMSQVIHQNACNGDADWNCGDGATYREDYVRTTVKQFWVNKVCSTSDTSPECLLVQIAFTNDYNKKANSWANKVVRTNYKPAGSECNINPASRKVKCSGIYNPDEKYPQDPNEENKGR
ncbi:MAG: hypothetical protein O9310_00320, partial [Leptospiraceae bacterium]|nr:hypothetical protein [Leptospiraceae bacterium]